MLSKSMTDTGRGSAGAGFMVNGMSSAGDPIFIFYVAGGVTYAAVSGAGLT